MTKLNNDKLNKIVGGTGSSNGSFQIGDWVYPKKTRLSPQGVPVYYRIDGINNPESRMPMYIVNVYEKDPFDGSLKQRSSLGSFLADELGHGYNPTIL